VIGLTPEIKTALSFLVEAHKINRNMKILGVCFGHQVISHLFGAKLAKKERKGGL